MLFEEPEHVLDTESAEISTPDSIQIEGVAGASPPQPQRLEAGICRVKTDQVAVHDVTVGRAATVVGVFVVLRAGFEVKVVPAGHGQRSAALIPRERDGLIGFRPAVRVGQFHLRPVSPRSSVGSWFPGGWLGERDGVAAQSYHELDVDVGELLTETRRGVPAIHGDDRRLVHSVSFEFVCQIANLFTGDKITVVMRPNPLDVNRNSPRRALRTDLCQPLKLPTRRDQRALARSADELLTGVLGGVIVKSAFRT